MQFLRSRRWRIFLIVWMVYSLHFATNVVREHYPAFSLAEHGTLRVDEYQERILDALKEAVAHSRDRENQGQLRRSQYQVYQAAHNLAAAL